MTKVEFARIKVEYDRKVNKVVIVVLKAAMVCGIVLSVVAIFTHGILKALAGAAMVASILGPIAFTQGRIDDADEVLPELRAAEADPEHGTDDLSETAYAYIRNSANEPKGQFFAYLALAITLTIFGPFLLLLGIHSSSLIIAGGGVVLIIGAVLLLGLTISCWRIWRLSKQVRDE